MQCRPGRTENSFQVTALTWTLDSWVERGSECDSLTPWLNPLTPLVDVLALAMPSNSFLALWAASLYMQLTAYQHQNHIYKQVTVAASPILRDSSSPWMKLKGALVFPCKSGPWHDHSEALEAFCLFFLNKILLYHQRQEDFFYKYCNNGHKWVFQPVLEHHLPFKCWVNTRIWVSRNLPCGRSEHIPTIW